MVAGVAEWIMPEDSAIGQANRRLLDTLDDVGGLGCYICILLEYQPQNFKVSLFLKEVIFFLYFCTR